MRTATLTTLLAPREPIYGIGRPTAYALRTLPYEPALTVDTSLPTGWNNVADVTPANSAALATALTNVVQNGSGPYIIELTAGVTYTGPFKILNKTGSQPLIIRSSAYASFAAQGTRVSPTDLTNYAATIKNTTTGVCMWFEDAAHNVHIMGINFTTDYAIHTAGSSCSLGLIQCGYNVQASTNPTSLAQLPSYITFDRVGVRGTTNGNVRRGIHLMCTHGAVVDSYINEIHEDGSDSQAIWAFNTPGPLKIQNNFLSASGENVMIGGADPQITGVIPSDITVKNNHFYKPLTWKSDDPSYNGYGYDVKNLFELKLGRRVLVEGNVLENCWPQNQSGYAVLITPRNQSGTANWSCVEDVTFRNNSIKNSLSGFQLLNSDITFAGTTPIALKRVLIENNLVTCDQTNLRQGAGSSFFFVFSASSALHPASGVTIRHNTCIHLTNGNALSTVALAGSATKFESDAFSFDNNLCHIGANGFTADGKSPGTSAFNYCFVAQHSTFLNNHLIRNGNASGTYPATTVFPTNDAAVGFSNYAAGDYSLTAASAYHHAASDGTDPGVDWAALQIAIATTITGGVVGVAPTITSNGGGATASVSVVENTTAVTTVTSNGDATISYSITSGNDQGKFAINSSTGALTFLVAPDYETPTDANTDNAYLVTVTATNSSGTDAQAITVTVTNTADTVPTFTSSATFSVAENQTAVGTVTTSGESASTYTITGGNDSSKFSIGSTSGVLVFSVAPDFEAPTDANTDNAYVVQVTATNSAGSTAQTITVTVTDVADTAPVLTNDGGGSTASLNVPEDTTAVTILAATGSPTPTFSITGGEDQAKFAVDANTGALTFSVAPDYETPTDANSDNAYIVEVTATNSAGTDVQTITVTVTAPPIFTSSSTFSVPENQRAIGHITVSGSPTPTSSIVGGADRDKFAFDPAFGILFFGTAPDYETPTDADLNNTYVVQMEANNLFGSATQTITVTVTNVLDGIAKKAAQILFFRIGA